MNKNCVWAFRGNGGACEYRGLKRFNGMYTGTATYCHFAEKWVTNLTVCPKDEEPTLLGELEDN